MSGAAKKREKHISNLERLIRTSDIGADEYQKNIFRIAAELWYEWWLIEEVQDERSLRAISIEPRIRNPQVVDGLEMAMANKIDMKRYARTLRELLRSKAPLLDLFIVYDRTVAEVATEIFGTCGKGETTRVRDRLGEGLKLIADARRLWGT